MEEFKAEAQAWIDDALKTVVEEPDPEGSGYYAAWIEPPPIDSDALALIAGDALQCMCSALDHLAFELATTFTPSLPDEFAKDSAFPIFGDGDGNGKKRFHQLRSKGPLAGTPAPNSGLAKIRGIDPLAQAEIEKLQPYNRGSDYALDPLWKLTVLNNLDKHRALHIIADAPVIPAILMPVPGPNLPRSRWPRNVAYIGLPDRTATYTIETGGEVAPKGRTKVARWPMVPVDPRKKMHMGFRPALDVVFGSDTPLVGGESVFTTLAQLQNYILRDVIPPVGRFLK